MALDGADGPPDAAYEAAFQPWGDDPRCRVIAAGALVAAYPIIRAELIAQILTVVWAQAAEGYPTHAKHFAKIIGRAFPPAPDGRQR